MPPEEQKSTIPPIFPGGIRRDLWEIIKILLISAAIVVPIRYFVVQPFIVRGASMEPNFHDREYLIIDEISYYFRVPERGETVVFRYPRDPSQYFIKRIIGLPGERVEVVDGSIKIYNTEKPDGFTLDESGFLSDAVLTRPEGDFELGRDEYFVLGDNRDASSDSRLWGPLREEYITGRALLRAWPLSRFGTITHSTLSSGL